MKTVSPGRRLIFSTVLFVTIIVPLSLSSNDSIESHGAPSTNVLIYGFQLQPLTKFYSDYFSQTFGPYSVQTRDLNITRWREEFLNVSKLVTALGIQTYVHNRSSCIPCQQQGHDLTMDDVLLNYGSPMVLVFSDGKLTMILFDGVDPEALVKSLTNLSEQVLVILTPNGNYFRYDAKSRTDLENVVFLDQKVGVELSDVVLPVISLALVDSINPCTFVLFTGLLMMVHMTSGRRDRTLVAGLLFTSAVFIGYYLLGMGFASLLGYATYLKLIVATLGIIMAASSITLGLMGAEKCPMPRSLKRLLMGELFERSYSSQVSAFALGLLSSFTLLPCSSGPYLVSLAFMQALRDTSVKYALLGFYNLVFIIPLIVISLVVFLLENAFDKIGEFKRTRLALVELIGGIALGIVSIYLLWQLLVEIGIRI